MTWQHATLRSTVDLEWHWHTAVTQIQCYHTYLYLLTYARLLAGSIGHRPRNATVFCSWPSSPFLSWVSHLLCFFFHVSLPGFSWPTSSPLPWGSVITARRLFPTLNNDNVPTLHSVLQTAACTCFTSYLCCLHLLWKRMSKICTQWLVSFVYSHNHVIDLVRLDLVRCFFSATQTACSPGMTCVCSAVASTVCTIS